jgi:SPP1 gp7 family putative phage head morphogenesis protein
MRPAKDKPVVVRAIHANAGVRAWYEVELLEAINAMHADVKRHVLAAYAEVAPAEMAHDADRNPSLFIRRALERWGGLWTRRLDKLSLDLSRKFASKSQTVTQASMRAAFKDAGFTVKFSPTPGSVAAYQAVVAEQVNLIKSIPQQYLKDVQTKVWQSVMRGADMHTLSLQLQDVYKVTANRAATIARDQNNKAKAIIERTRRQEIGVTHAIWMHSAGGRVPRKTHVAMDGKPYALAVGMWDPDEGAYVLPGELINCRCTSKAVIPAFDNVKEATARARASRPTELLNAARARAR